MDALFAIPALLAGFVTGVLTIGSRYPDDPFRVLAFPATWGYLVLNGILGTVSYYVMSQMCPLPENLFTHLGYSALVGFCAVAVSRFEIPIRIGNKTIVLSLGKVVDQALGTMDHQIDHRRSTERLGLVREVVTGMSFQKIARRARTLIPYASRRWSPKEQKELEIKIDHIANQELDTNEKAEALGLVIIDLMGTNFLSTLIDDIEKNMLPEAVVEGQSLINIAADCDIADLVRGTLADVPFAEARQRFEELVNANADRLPAAERLELNAELRQIENENLSDQEKTHGIGLMMLDFFQRDEFLDAFSCPKGNKFPQQLNPMPNGT